MLTERDVYRNELLKLGHGLPIYEPDPSVLYDYVRVGDVGYADRFGFFHRIFNVYRDRSDAINQQHGTPEDFVPLENNFRGTYPRSPIPAGAMLSRYIRLLGASCETSGSCIPANASIRFSVSNQQGAALIIKHPAFREDSVCEEHLGSYMLKHYRSWFKFMRDHLRRPVSLEDVVLVTGCDLTADWATLTIVESSVDCEIEFKAADPISTASGSVGFWGNWQTSISAPHRCGPVPVRPPTFDSDGVSTAQSAPEGWSAREPRYNQCIFLRGYRVKERLRIPKLIKAAAEPEDMDMDRDGDASAFLSSLEYDYDSEEYVEDPDCEDASGKHISPFHDAAFTYIFEKTDVDIALVHDNDICRSVKHADSHMLKHECVEFFKDANIGVATRLVDDSQLKVGYIVASDLHDTADSPTPTGSSVTLFPVARSETTNGPPAVTFIPATDTSLDVSGEAPPTVKSLKRPVSGPSDQAEHDIESDPTDETPRKRIKHGLEEVLDLKSSERQVRAEKVTATEENDKFIREITEGPKPNSNADRPPDSRKMVQLVKTAVGDTADPCVRTSSAPNDGTSSVQTEVEYITGSPFFDFSTFHSYDRVDTPDLMSCGSTSSASRTSSGSRTSSASRSSTSDNWFEGITHPVRQHIPTGVPLHYPEQGHHVIKANYETSEGEERYSLAIPIKTSNLRREEIRRERIEAEQRRRDELRDGYHQLKAVLPVSNEKSSKVSLLNRATNHVKDLEMRLHQAEIEIQRLRSLHEPLVPYTPEGQTIELPKAQQQDNRDLDSVGTAPPEGI